jgi:hypothetical protein
MNRSNQRKQMMKCGGKTKAKKMAKGGKAQTCRGGGEATGGKRFNRDG